MGRTSDAKERILETAETLIHDRGYNAVGISEICSQAGVNKGSFYHFFPSKQQLVLDLVDGYWHSSRGLLEEHLRGDGPALERLDRYFQAIDEYHRQGQAEDNRLRGCPLGNLSLEMAGQDPVLRERLQDALENHILFFERLLREAQMEEALAPDLDLRQSAEALLALLEGQILLAKVRNNPEPLAHLPHLARRLLGAQLA